MQNMKYYVPGSILIAIALMIMIFPEILVAFVAALIIMAGVSVLYVGHQMRKSEIESSKFHGWAMDDDKSWNWFERFPRFKKWHHRF